MSFSQTFISFTTQFLTGLITGLLSAFLSFFSCMQQINQYILSRNWYKEWVCFCSLAGAPTTKIWLSPSPRYLPRHENIIPLCKAVCLLIPLSSLIASNFSRYFVVSEIFFRTSVNDCPASDFKEST